MNPHGPCVANADINGSQMTVTFHVDDLKVSHKDPFEVTKFATFLSKVYGKKLTVKRGKVTITLDATFLFSWRCES